MLLRWMKTETLLKARVLRHSLTRCNCPVRFNSIVSVHSFYVQCCIAEVEQSEKDRLISEVHTYPIVAEKYTIVSFAVVMHHIRN
jgi:hypothetical protein